MTNSEDARLRSALRAFAREAPAGLPSFDALASSRGLESARRRRRRRRVVLGALVTAACVVPILLSRHDTDMTVDVKQFMTETGIDLGGVTWQAPSDALFQIANPRAGELVPSVLGDTNTPPHGSS